MLPCCHVAELSRQLQALRDEAGLTLAIFSNGPRVYCLRCLDALAIRHLFPDDHIFAVEDVLPACKPEVAAFEQVLTALGAQADTTVMFEDSMKNIRSCKAQGMGTVLLLDTLQLSEGTQEKPQGQSQAPSAAPQGDAAAVSDVPVETSSQELALQGEARLLGDTPLGDDSAVDVVLRRITDIEDAIPELFQRQAMRTRRRVSNLDPQLPVPPAAPAAVPPR